MGFFKAYDMRGTFGADFDLDTVYKVGRSLPKVVKGRRWLVGRDCRATSDAVRDALVKGLSEAGAEVSDLGRCTTPMVYYFTAEDGYDGSVMVTASHNPPTDNGLKVSKATALPVGYADGLNEVERLVKEADRHEAKADGAASSVSPRDPMPDALARYVAWQKGRVNLDSLKNLKFAVDCSNGMASLFACEMFPGAVLLNDTPDGSFPAHSPNPLKAEAREQIARVVREKGLDCGVVFDGDADRAMFVDERGEFVQPDYLIPIVARATRDHRTTEPPNHLTTALPNHLKIIHDVRTSRGAIETLREDGFEPEMVPVGHAFAKPILRKIGALCGGELAGHYYFSEFFGCDSGLLAATRILGEIAKAKAEGRTFSEMMKPIVSRYANSGEINFKVEDKEAAIERVLAVAKTLGVETSRSEIDGYRLEYREGWISIRKSNTEPYLRLLVECDTRERLDEWVERLGGAINAVASRRRLRTGDISMKMRLTFVAIGLLGLSGCCSCAYFDDACTRPEESSSSGLHCGRREEWPRACMNITAKECGFIADGMGEDVVLGSLLGLCLLPDVACSLCVDLVTMPWQLSRYKDFPEKRTMDPSLVKNSSWSDPTYRGAAVPEVLRGLRSRQAADGRWTGGKSVLADTALVALALAWRGEYLKPDNQDEGDDNFAPMLRDAEKYLVRCATVSGDTVRLLGEDADPRAFPIAAAALAELGGRIHREETWTLAQKCLSRAAVELVREQQVELTELSAERLGWLVLALQAGLNGGWKMDGIEDVLDAVRTRLLDYPPLKGSYYDTRRLYAGFLRGDPDLGAQYLARIKENKKWILDNIGSTEIVRGADGKLHWKASLYRIGTAKERRGSGLGQTADDALGVLQVTFPVSHRPSASQKAKEGL